MNYPVPPGYQLVQVGYSPYAAIGGADPDMAMLLGRSGGDEMSYNNGRGGQSGYRYATIGATDQELAAEIQKRQLQQSVLLREQAPIRAREYPLGFDSVNNIGAGATVPVTQQPQILFRSERLVVPSDIAGQFLITELLCGKDNMFAASGPVHARTFDERAVGVRLSLATSQVSQQIVMRVQNIGGAPARFFATMIGTAVE